MSCRYHPDGCLNPEPIPSPEEIEAEGKKPLDADDLEIIEQALVSAGVLGTTLTKVVRMYREAQQHTNVDGIRAPLKP